MFREIDTHTKWTWTWQPQTTFIFVCFASLFFFFFVFLCNTPRFFFGVPRSRRDKIEQKFHFYVSSRYYTALELKLNKNKKTLGFSLGYMTGRRVFFKFVVFPRCFFCIFYSVLHYPQHTKHIRNSVSINILCGSSLDRGYMWFEYGIIVYGEDEVRFIWNKYNGEKKGRRIPIPNHYKGKILFDIKRNNSIKFILPQGLAERRKKGYSSFFPSFFFFSSYLKVDILFMYGECKQGKGKKKSFFSYLLLEKCASGRKVYVRKRYIYM